MYNGDKNKTRTTLTIDYELKRQLEEIAKQENRSFNNLVVFILKSYVEKAGK